MKVESELMRTAMLRAWVGALIAGEVAREASITPQMASSHRAKLQHSLPAIPKSE